MGANARLIAVVLSAGALLLSACGDPAPEPRVPIPDVSDPQPEPEPEAEPEPEPEPEPENEIVEISTGSSCVVTGDLEGAFTESSQMASYLGCIVPGVEQWIDSVYANMPHPGGYFFVPLGASSLDIGCPIDATVMLYCTGSKRIYLGEEAVWTQYSVFGDAAPAVVLAHEVTHHFQEIVMTRRGPTTQNEIIPYENQADCGAGAFMNYASVQQWMNPDDDIVDLAGSLQAAGEAEGVGRSHGTPAERLTAFDTGFLSPGATPLGSCNAYVPAIMIIDAS